jgi:hypothetical protein
MKSIKHLPLDVQSKIITLERSIRNLRKMFNNLKPERCDEPYLATASQSGANLLSQNLAGNIWKREEDLARLYNQEILVEAKVNP